MATAFGDLGSTVHIVELADRIMGNEDPLVSSTMQNVFESRGVHVHLGTSIKKFDESTHIAHLTNGETIASVDKVLIGIGRRPALANLGIEEAGVESSKGGIVADTWGRTSVDGVYAIGYITGNTATTHGANSIARRTIRAIALPLPKIANPLVIPNAVYSRPQIASVGLTLAEVDAMAPGGRKRYVKHLTDLYRGFTDDLEHGFIAVDV